MKRPRLHWAWRTTVAVLIASAYGGMSITVFENYHEWVAEQIAGGWPPPDSWRYPVAGGIAWFAPITLLAFAVYGLLTRFFGPTHDSDNETRCRRCGYILRGITEPRCPECGERI